MEELVGYRADARIDNLVKYNSGGRPLSMNEFFIHMGYSLDYPYAISLFPLFYTRVYRTIHVSRRLLSSFGYRGSYGTQMHSFTDMLQRKNISYRVLQYPRDMHEIFDCKTIMKTSDGFTNPDHRRWVVMYSDDLKLAMMNINTEEGPALARLVVRLEYASRMYTEYRLKVEIMKGKIRRAPRVRRRLRNGYPRGSLWYRG